jgi:hypothetical protein
MGAMGRPPLMPHQRRPKTRVATLREAAAEPERDKTPKGEKLGRPEMPKEFKTTEIWAKKHRLIWKEYITPSDWLVHADTPMAIMFCMLWKKFLDSGYKPTFSLMGRLKAACVELGFSPLSRSQMKRVYEKKQDSSKYAGRYKNKEERQESENAEASLDVYR